MITVGYGDVPISNSIERLIAIVAMFAGVIFFSLIIGSLTALIGEMDKRGTAYESKLNILLKLKKKYEISDYTFERVHLAIKYRIYRSNESYDEFLSTLPDNLKEELAYTIYKPLVKGLRFFELGEKDFISAIGPFLNTVHFNRGEVIYAEGEYAKEMFFIKRGSVVFMMSNDLNTPFMQVRKGNYFGEIDMLFGQHRKFRANAATDVSTLALSFDDFQRVITYQFKHLAKFLR